MLVTSICNQQSAWALVQERKMDEKTIWILVTIINGSYEEL